MRTWTVAVMVLLLAACADAAAESDFMAAVEALTVDGTLPIMALANQADLDEAEHTAVEAEIAACMERGGFTYEPMPWFGPKWVDAGRYGLTDVTAAMEWGYEGPPPDERHLLADEWQAREPPPEWGWEEALFGAERAEIVENGRVVGSYPVGGCIEAGHTVVVGDYRAWFDLMQALQWIMAEASRPAADDPRVLAVVAAWSDCMAAAGYPGSVFIELHYTGRAAAVADATCNVAVGVAITSRAVEAEHQWDALAEHEALLTELLGRTTVSLKG